MTTPAECPFCFPAEDRIAFEDRLTRALWDAFPVSEGHLLIVPRRHVPTWFDASQEERVAITRAIDRGRELIEGRHHPDGYNIGVNVGEAAGQTVFHLHVHLSRDHRRRPRPGRRRETRYPRQGQLPGTGGRRAAPEHIGVGRLTGYRSCCRKCNSWNRQRSRQPCQRRPCRPRAPPAPRTSSPEARTTPSSRAWAESWPKPRRDIAVAFVGSSNLSESALLTGIEWNYRAVAKADAYRQRRPTPEGKRTRGPVEVPEEPATIPTPHAIQQEALKALPPASARPGSAPSTRTAPSSAASCSSRIAKRS
jgi:diadenosine tetraphosphate (Ap4A) HIT family hydrolase